MAKIALMIGLGILGAITGGLAAAGYLSFGFAGGAGGLTGALLGGSIGLSAGGLLGQLIFPGHNYTYGTRLNDLQVSSSANGSPYPWGYGGFRIGGQIIWSSGIKETTTKTTTSAKGGPTSTNTQYTYRVSIAVAFVQGPANITRIWMDSRLVYDVTGKGAISSDVLDTGIVNVKTNLPVTQTIVPTIYPGNQTQLPDPTVQAAEGINSTPAFRNTCYLVYEDLPLADFGNRIPNIRAEISVSTSLVYLKDTYSGTSRFGDPRLTRPTYTYVDSVNRKAYIADGFSLTNNCQQVNLVADDTSPLNGWLPSTVYHIGDEILDSNGDVQVVIAVSNQSGPPFTTGISGSTGYYAGFNGHPEWQPEGATTFDPYNGAYPAGLPPYNIQWKNLGKGPEAVVISAQGTLTPILEPGESIAQIDKGATMGIDPSGNIWQTVFITGGAGGTTLQCYDPTSFLAKKRFVMPIEVIVNPGYGPTAISFSRTPNGDFMFVAVGYNNGGKVYIYDLTHNSGPIITTGLISQAPGGIAKPNYPTVGQANGHLYSAYFTTGFGFTTNTYVVDLDLTTGSVRQSPNLYATIGGTNPNLFIVLWNPADHTLIGICCGGKIVKIDPTSWAVLAQTGDAAVYVDGSNPDPAYFTQSGLLPPDGTLRVLKDVSGTTHLDVYDSNLNLLSDTSITNWFVNITGGGGFNPSTIDGGIGHDFDSPTDSLIMTTPASAIYTGSSYRVYINRQLVSGSDLGVVVTDLLTRTGMNPARIDVSRITGTVVLGYPITQNTSCKNLLGVLCQAYYFDLVETDFMITAIPRGGATAMNVPEADLGIEQDQFKIQETIAQENDLPQDLAIHYSDPALDYQQGKQLRKRHRRVKKTRQHTVIEIPLTMTADTAAALADKALKTVWTERNGYDFKLWKAQYLVLDPTDIIQFTYEGMPFVARLAKATLGVNNILEISGVSEDASLYISSFTGNSGAGFISQSLNPVAPTLLFIFDVPLLQDVDASPAGSTGYYFGMSSLAKGWQGAGLFTSADGETWTAAGFSSTGLAFGSAFAALPAPRSEWTWDDVNTVTVIMTNGTLSSTTALNVLNGANAALLGDEIIQFQTATLNANGTYTLSSLLRGRRGTEWACNQHLSGETFVLLSTSTLQRNSVSTALINLQRDYKAVTAGQTTDQAQSKIVTLEGNDLRPYAPSQFVSTFDVSNNYNFSWVRRTRIGGAWQDGVGVVPLSEESESYDLDILMLDGGGKNIPMYDISVNSVGIVKMTAWVVGFSIVHVANLIVGPFTITWADGTVASYLGHTFGGASANVPQGSPLGNLVVHDPNRTGDANGGSVVYSMETPAWAHFSNANLPGYYFLGQIPNLPAGATDGTTVAITPGGSDVVVRSIKGLTSPSYQYTDAAQFVDFGAHPSTFPKYIRAKVFQNSATVGRGFPAQNVAPAGGELLPVPSSGGFSGDATSINGIPIVGTPAVGQVLEYNGVDWVPATIAAGARTIVSKTTASLTNGQTETGSMTLAKTLALLGATTTKDCRIQLYETAAYRDADAARLIGINPEPGTLNGIIADLVLTSAVGTWDFSPPLLGANRDVTPGDVIYYRITNLGTTGAITVTVTYLPLES